MGNISRERGNWEGDADTTLNDSDVIRMEGNVAGMMHIPAGATTQQITFYSSDSETGTYLPAYDDAGNAIVLSVQASRAYQFPVALAGARFIKMVAAAADIDDIVICLKG